MINHTYFKIKSKIKIKLFSLGKDILREHLGCTRLREGKLSLVEIVSLALLVQFHPPKNLKHFYEHEMLNYVKYRPSYANFLKHLRQSAELIKHLTDLKILQNSLYLDETTVLLDSTKVEINKHIKRQVKSHRYFPAGKPSRGHTSTGEFYGFKLSTLNSESGCLLGYDIQTASRHDSYILNELLQFPVFKYQPITHLLADKGYIHYQKQAEFKEKGIELITPNKSNSRRLIHPEFHQLYYKRQGIERYYKKLKEDQGFNKFYFNKSDASLQTKIFANLLLAELHL